MYFIFIAIYGNSSQSFLSDQTVQTEDMDSVDSLKPNTRATYLSSEPTFNLSFFCLTISFIFSYSWQSETKNIQNGNLHIKLFTSYIADISYRLQVRIKDKHWEWLTKTTFLPTGVVKYLKQGYQTMDPNLASCLYFYCSWAKNGLYIF